MTVTVEEFYGSPVDVRVLECRRDGNEYARKILLTAHATGQVVQFGLVRINLGVCPRSRCGTRSSRGRRRSAAC